MPEAPRVLIAIQPSMYAEVLAFNIGQHRPEAEVSVLGPSEDWRKRCSACARIWSWPTGCRGR
jgi:hypothetical protein